MQFVISNFVGPELPDVLASLFSLVCVILFVQVWKPRDIDAYRASFSLGKQSTTVTSGDSPIGEQAVPVTGSEDDAVDDGVGTRPTSSEAIFAWLPWLLVSAIVIAWTFLKVPTLGALSIHWPGLDKQVFLTLYNKPYTAVYAFQPLGTGTAILLAVIITAIVMIAVGAHPQIAWRALVDTWRQLRFAILTVVLIVGLAYLYNYSGMSYTLGLAISKVGAIFPFFSVFLGWIACFLSGSDTSSNALFGNLQVVAARQLNLSPVLMAATNSSGAVMSKMISPQNVSTGVSTTVLAGKEGLIIRRTFFHSIILAAILGVIVMLQQYLIPGIIPH
jgi:L-lactate permease